MFTFNHFNFNVLDLERSVRFYHDALGLEPVRTKDAADGSFRLVFLGDGHSPFQLELTGLRGRTQPYDLGEGEFHLAFSVPDMDAAHAKHAAMAASALKIPAWASTSSRTRTGTGSRSCRKSESPRRRRKNVSCVFLYSENHSLGEWFKKSLEAIMKTKNSFCFRMSVRSANCTKKQKEVITCRCPVLWGT